MVKISAPNNASMLLHAPERVVYDNLRSLGLPALLNGDGRQFVSYKVEYDKRLPWAGVSADELRAAIADTLTRAGLDAGGASFELESKVLRWEHSPVESSVVLTLKDGAPSDVEIYRRFHQAWPHDRFAMPHLRLALDPFSAPKATAPPSTYLPEQLLSVGATGELEVRQVTLSPEARTKLMLWASGVTGRPSTSPERALLALLRAPTDLTTPAGRQALDAMRDVDLFSPFWSAAVTSMAHRFAPGAARGVDLIYNGHATFHIASLLPSLRAFGMERVTTWVSNKSCSSEGRAILRLQNEDARFFSETIAESRSVEYDSQGKRREAPRARERKVGFTDFMDHVEGQILRQELGAVVVDKVGPWLEARNGRVSPTLLDGRMRVIIHNRDDLGAMGDVAKGLWGVDLAGSLLKKLEARFIGEQNALIGAREARQILGERLGDLPVVIVGFGLLGEQLGRALGRLGMPKANIKVVDPSPEVLVRARKLGFSTQLASAAERPPKAVVFVATPGVGVGPHNVHNFADELVVISLTSGGKGVDRSLTQKAVEVAQVGEHRNTTRDAVADLTLTLADPQGRQTRATLFAEGQSANLVDNMWHDRFQVTSLGVAVAAVQAASLTSPGIQRLTLDLPLVRLSKKHGLWEPRPLAARPGDDPALLAQDLTSFAPSRRGERP